MKDYSDLIARLRNYPNEARDPMRDEAADALEELTAPVKSEPVAWMVTTECIDGKKRTYPISGRFKDVNDVCDFGEPEPLYSESRVRELEQQVEMLSEFVSEVLAEGITEFIDEGEIILAATEGEK